MLNGGRVAMSVVIRETDVAGLTRDRKEECRVMIASRIEVPPLAAVARGKMSVSNMVQSQCATLNVKTRSGLHRLSARSSVRETAFLSGLCTIAVSHFFSKRLVDTREISTQHDRSHIAMSCNAHKTWKASPSLQTVADLQARPRSEVALIFKNRGAPRTD